ncbi:MAG TPA: roadblock/LC7 domain-containing protein [Thermoplasmata archaeon]|jgi:predicted regulator of Ras-like GTPase activity (Roadblock/LC7/MglB family)|nr:roadblock/LC7 domain-containing protein [Thermoplasmata archaeon]
MRPNARLVPVFSVTDALSAAIREATSAGAIQEIVIARPDGLPIAHNLAEPGLAKRIAAMSAAIVGTGKMATTELHRGTIQGITVDSAEARIVCLPAGDEAIVTGLAPGNANVGLMLLVLRELAKKVAAAIDRWNKTHPLGR